ncbi:oxidoreductase domain protein [Thermodesulfobacterium geofontis OPF15]|uniref:Oxidoreductase domain protein n=1 Tax=Thermodesulfobacterium geofontis (strain OPF15) TaxID=795359 RepID=F8C1Y9_THEGP|nr:Gfo/Idh/MocA family oxidoreductase [Thermodesulfobacterium geofontis]AEH23318.1 oxidoreductase domain protein [Thermodesulfobacterium geofontis OPF15]
MSTAKLKIAIIGCGKAAERHKKIYQALKDEVEVVCVSDLEEEKAQKFAEALSAKSYTDYKEMLTKEDVEVVDLCLPSGLHAEVGEIILKDFKRHLLVEKPLALTLKEAKNLVILAQKYQLKLVTVFQNRANPPVIKLKEALSQNLLGNPILFSAKFYWSRDQKYYNSASWRGTWALDGGALAQQGCHFVDMLYYLGGPVESVFAKMGTYLANIEAEDLLVGILKFKNGALGTIEATTCSRPKDLKAELVVLGEKGSAILGGFAMNKLDYLAIEGIENINEFISGFEKNPDHPLGYSHYTYLRSAIKYFKTSEKDPWLVVGEEAIPSLEIIIGLYESAETGKEIKFPFKPKACRLGKR